MRKSWLIALAVLFLLGLGAGAGAETTHPLMVDVAWLQQNVNNPDVIVVDVRPEDAYKKGHIPGAVSIDVNLLQSKPNSLILAPDKAADVLGKKGIDGSKRVVLYGEGKEIAFLEFWMLDYLGVPDVKVLDGGIEAWEKAGGQLSQEERTLPATTFKPNPDKSKIVSVDDVLAALKDPKVQILDVRTPGEFKGTDVRALRGGHIPGAINIPYEDNFQENSTVLKPLSELEKMYAGKLDKAKTIIVYCQTGTRSTNTYLVLKELGYKVRNFDASWVVWGSRVDLPAENVTWYNFVPVNNAIKDVNKLKEQVAAAPAAPAAQGGAAEQAPRTGGSSAGPYLVAIVALAVAFAALLRKAPGEAHRA